MPKKRPSRNGFYYFMLDWKKQAETNGYKFSTLTDVQKEPKLSEDWRRLSAEQKAYYAAMSKNPVLDKKKTTLGEDIDLIEQKELEKQLSFNSMVENITETVTSAVKHNMLHKLTFCFIHVNYYYVRVLEDGEVKYTPAEFAVVQFSLEHGIRDTYYEILNADIEKGYAREAMETSLLTHKIPYDISDGQSDYMLMYNKLVQFLNPVKRGKQMPPLYCTNAVSGPAISLLNKMADTAGVQRNTFTVYSMEQLYARLLNSLIELPGKASIPIVVSQHDFLMDAFTYVSGTECDYHKLLDGTSQYCSLSIVKQWAFIICNRCCQPMKINMIEGVHYPKPSYTKTEDDEDLNTTLSRLHLENRPRASVGQDYRSKLLEKSRPEEGTRQKDMKPLTIINYSKLNNNSQTEPASLSSDQKIKTFASCTATYNDAPAINDMNFPKIGGRGMAIRSRIQELKLPLGRGMPCKK